MTQDGKAVTGSPFKINITDAQVSSAHKVKVAGATKTAVANQWNDIKINIQEAGRLRVHSILNKLVPCA